MTAINNNGQASPNAQLIAQGASANPSSATGTTGTTGTTNVTGAASASKAGGAQSLYPPGGGARQSSLQDRAGSIATAHKSGSNVGNIVASDFGAWCQSRGVPKSAASFANFSQQYSAGLQQGGLSSADANTAISQGQSAIISGQQVRNFTLGQGQV